MANTTPQTPQTHPGFIKNLLNSDQYADMVIVCGAETFNVHRNVVCTQSKFFANALKFPDQEEKGKITLPVDEPEIIKLLLQYLYEGDYDPPLSATPPASLQAEAIVLDWNVSRQTQPHNCAEDLFCSSTHLFVTICPYHICGEPRGSWPCAYDCADFRCPKCTADTQQQKQVLAIPAEQLLIHSKMYQVGDKYVVNGLKEIAKSKFDQACKQLWNDPIFPTAAEHVFSSTPDNDTGLRDIVIDTIVKHLELVHKPEIFEFISETGSVAATVLQKRVRMGAE